MHNVDSPACINAADEFVAHSSTVNCLRIGRNTAGVLATGGEDKKVNLWRIGQPHVAKVCMCCATTEGSCQIMLSVLSSCAGGVPDEA